MKISQIPGLTASVLVQLYRLARLTALVAVFYLVYRALLDQILDGSQELFAIFAFWIVTAYAALPRLHRILTKYYLPNYYVGRIRSPDGFLSDPVNLVFYGKARDVHSAMAAAGWKKADKLTIKSAIKTAYCSLFRKSYPTAPVGSMFLFSRKQDFAYEQEIGGSPNRRHHVRFWRTKKGWRLPGGRRADWLAAATYDTHVGIKIATGQINHVIHEHIDEERDYIIKTLRDAKRIIKLDIVKHFTDAYHDRNNGGDRIKTDGSLPFITVGKPE